METMYEYGARVGFWRLMDIFDEHDVKSTFYRLCRRARAKPQGRAARSANAAMTSCCHGYRWEDVTLLSREQEREHIRLAVKSIAETTGERPLGWYCRYGPSVNTRELIVEEGGFVYDLTPTTTTCPTGRRSTARSTWSSRTRLVNNDSRFGAGHFGPPEDFEEHLRYTFDRLYKEGATHPKMMSIGLHMRLAGHPARVGGGVEIHRLRPVVPRCMVRQTDRHCPPLAREPCVTDVAALKQAASAAIDAASATLFDISAKMHADVELAFEEVKAQAWQCNALRDAGLVVEEGLGSLKTAFRATASLAASGASHRLPLRI